ncbi:MGMT family protein [Brevibacterium daeguense]|nr:MGMT family protein [Brevibacterium daeguense]
MDERRVELVLRAAECIPPGSVAPYSMLARITGTTARYVGKVMAEHGSFVPWWRVTNVRGELPAAIRSRAAEHWHDEGIPHRDGRVDLPSAAADEHELRRCWLKRSADLWEQGEPG